MLYTLLTRLVQRQPQNVNQSSTAIRSRLNILRGNVASAAIGGAVFALTLVSNQAMAYQYCAQLPAPGAWDLADNAILNIPMDFNLGDEDTNLLAFDNASVKIDHTYAGDLGGRIFTPDNTNLHLWQLGDGTVAPNTSPSGVFRDG